MNPLIRVGAMFETLAGESVEIVKINLNNPEGAVLGVVNNCKARYYTEEGRWSGYNDRMSVRETLPNTHDLILEPLDAKKPVKTRAGKAAIILTCNYPSKTHPIQYVYEAWENVWITGKVTLNGRHLTNGRRHVLDLVNI